MAPLVAWSQLHDRFYRKHETYLMAWQFARDLGRFRIRACPGAGPLAVVRAADSSSKSGAQGVSGMKNQLLIFSLSGHLLRQWNLENKANATLVDLGWDAAAERVCLVWDDATVHVYSLAGDYEHVSLGLSLSNSGLAAAQFFDGGMVVMTRDFQFHVVEYADSPAEFHTKPLVSSGLTEAPSSWTILPPRSVGNMTAEVLYSSGDYIFQLDGREKKLVTETGSPVLRMQLSPNGKLVAIFTENCKLQAFSCDFQSLLLEFPAKSKKFPDQLAWCGNDAIALAWDDILLLLGPYGNWIKFNLEPGVTCLFSEIDCLRLVSLEKCELIEKVPQCVEDVFRIGSTKPAALAFDAFDAFDRRDAKADDIARSIRDQMAGAVDTLLEAAGREFEPSQQKSLMKAASFGKSFIGSYAAETFVKMSQTIRVLNSLRDHQVGLPLTYEQYAKLSSERLLAKLTCRDQHALAIQICDLLKLNSRAVILDWITKKLKISSESDNVLYDEIMPKIGRGGRVLPIEVARIAFSAGRPTLSTLFLASNSKLTFDQIPLLLDMQENEVALTKALGSGDTDLVFVVLFNLKHRLPLGEFLHILNAHPAAMNLFEGYCRVRDPDMLKNLLYQADRKLDSALHTLSLAWSVLPQDEEGLGTALKQIHNQRDCAFPSRMVDECVRLSALQEQFMAETGQSFSGLTLSETLYKLIFLNRAAKAQRLKSDFGVPDKRFWYLKIRAMADAKDWDGLDKFSRSRKPPVGFKAFVDQCVANGNVLEAKKYVLKCETHQRPQLFVDIGAFREAAQAAYANKDAAFLGTLRERVQNTVLREEIDQWVYQLGMRQD